MPVSVGPMELIIVLIIALVVLGPKRLPEAGKALGKGLREFKDSVSGITAHDDEDEDGEPAALPRDRSATPR
jgi:sec-independent protein translocase protein TatA